MRCDRNARNPFPTKQGNGPSSRDEEGKTGVFLSCVGTLSVPLSGDGYFGELLSCIHGVKDPFEAQDERWDFSRDVIAEKGLISL